MSATTKQSNDKYRLPTDAEIRKWPRWRRIAYAIVPFNMYGLPKSPADWIEFVETAYGREAATPYINTFKRCHQAAKSKLL